MCLGVPGKVIQWIEREGIFARAEVEFAGVKRVCHMACATDASEGQYVLIHAGIAISVIDEAAAQRLLQDLADLEWVEQLGLSGDEIRR